MIERFFFVFNLAKSINMCSLLAWVCTISLYLMRKLVYCSSTIRTEKMISLSLTLTLTLSHPLSPFVHIEHFVQVLLSCSDIDDLSLRVTIITNSLSWSLVLDHNLFKKRNHFNCIFHFHRNYFQTHCLICNSNSLIQTQNIDFKVFKYLPSSVLFWS